MLERKFIQYKIFTKLRLGTNNKEKIFFRREQKIMTHEVKIGKLNIRSTSINRPSDNALDNLAKEIVKIQTIKIKEVA